MTTTRATAWPTRQTTSAVVLVLLAGGLRHSPLRQGIGIPTLCLPLQAGQTLLDRWLAAAQQLSTCDCVIIAVSHAADASGIRRALASLPEHRLRSLNVAVVESTSWRGPAGMLFDLARSSHLDHANSDDTIVIAAEAARTPPNDFQVVLDAVDARRAGISLTTGTGEPAGLYAFTAKALSTVPAHGFYDIKEQLLPRLYESGTPLQAVQIASRSHRICDRESYLQAVGEHAADQPDSMMISPDANIAATARIAGPCLIQAGATIHAEAVVHKSVVLANASVGCGAVVSRSIIGPSAQVLPGGHIKQRIMAHSRASHRQSAMKVLSKMLRWRSQYRGTRLA